MTSKDDTGVLQPPTTRFLSDRVIGRVLQRTTKVSNSERPQLSEQDAVEPVSPTDRKRKRQDAAKDAAAEALAQVVTQDWFIKHEEQQRELRRVRQIRYRQKQQDYLVATEEGNRELQREILKLEKRRNAVFAGLPSEKTLWNVAVEYFRLFRYGFRASDLINRSVNGKASAQLDFLRSNMAPDVLYNAGRGVEAVLKNWAYFSLWFEDVEVQLDGLKKNGRESLVASTSTTFKITKKTVSSVFPHLCGQEADSAACALASKLIDQTIVVYGLTRFEWDGVYGRVTSVISESDMLTPMLRVLGSLEDVSCVFGESLISLTPYRGQSI